MNAMARPALTAALVFLFAYAAYTQQATQEKTGISVQPAANTPPRASEVHLPAPSSHMPVVTGAPYSAEVVYDHIQTLADGTHITQKAQSTRQYRDSEGRTRTESSPGGAQVVEIHDPISGFRYLLDVENRVAHRFAPPAEKTRGMASYAQTFRADSLAANSAAGQGIASAQASSDRPETVTESLGSQIIEGVYVKGQKTTITFPVGSVGNDRPLVRVTESWVSPDLKIIVLSKHSDPRMGESTTLLRNINRSEPDPALFAVPAEYQIVDENSDRVELKFSRP